MGGMTRSPESWWEYFKSLFNIKNYYIDGTVTVCAGFHQIEIPTVTSNPCSVFLSIEEPDSATTTCVGDLNWATAKVQLNGFTLYANIKSNTCTIKYVIQYDCDNSNPQSPIGI
jgi:hypothetical protein